MSNLSLQIDRARAATPPPPHRRFGDWLLAEGLIRPADLDHALTQQSRIDAPLGEILVGQGLLSRPEMLGVLSRQHCAQLVDLARSPPPRDIARLIPVDLCLRLRLVPWLRIGEMLLVATSRPDLIAQLRTSLGADPGRIYPVIAEDSQIGAEISRLYGQELACRAALRVPAEASCRGWDIASKRRLSGGLIMLAALAMALLLAPLWSLTLAMLWAFATLLMTTALKAAALVSQLRAGALRPLPQISPPAVCTPFRLPRVSVLVPLLKEEDIADALVARLARLTYPKSLLDVVLVLEAGDAITRQTLARTALPDWISVIEVPEANRLTTKPRALNYALDFCRGSIVGVWDAEDAPEHDQIEKVVSRFQQAPPHVACLQGALDYYNCTSNWMSRCFTIEYATWWRMILPGVARLGLVLPLGGTTLFFRRAILESLGGWDAHNVTEDADLGIRLARQGYVTELIDTVTYEEANCRAWPWVRQRSRWLKGFLITWCVHMRAPRRLWADLGPLRFLGVQTLLLATFSQFTCAPLLWSFWLTLFGIAHPVAQTLGNEAMWAMAGFFLAAEVLNLSLSLCALTRLGRPHLLGWVFTLPFYFLLGALAALKALQEFVTCPFYWDKTEHGISKETR
ncbi:glycosyltransferase family 2 protein [Sulfitobacter aestuarii]|uniref:Glycosyltransferase family 2 protein n=1 Tax=Sulfitobacter aestuarii TaxID=2161676 RepID=A0ABW5TYF2_9RHOB